MNIFLDIIAPRSELIEDLENTSNLSYNNTNRIITIIGTVIILLVILTVGFIKIKNKNENKQ